MSLEKKKERLERYYLEVIHEQRHEHTAKILRAFFKYCAYLYAGLIWFWNFLYEKGILRHHTLGCQVISIGNLTAGGTGKTPIVEIFARTLQREGRHVAILSRGYKKVEHGFWKRQMDKLTGRERRRPPRVVSDGKSLLLDSARSGDEPYMLASNLPEVAVLVDKDRVKSGRYAIEKLKCDTLLLDDGFQYRALKHRVEIVLVDSTNPFSNGHIIPRGLLREPIKNIKRADFIFITKATDPEQADLKAQLRQLNPRAEISVCAHQPLYLQNVYTGARLELSWLKGRRVATVAGIAIPEGFENEIRRLSGALVCTERFADHHRYTQQEIIDIINRARQDAAEAIITTEKDAVRFPQILRVDVPIYFLRVEIKLLSGVEDFNACISRICFR